MPLVSPCNHRLVKKINNALLVAVTYKEVPEEADKIDCCIEFINTKYTEKITTDGDSHANALAAQSAEADDDSNATTNGDEGWFRSFFSSEKVPLAKPEAPELPLLLGYVQMLGYVRLNMQPGGEGASERSSGLLWKNPEYLLQYVPDEVDQMLSEVERTEFIKQHGKIPGRLGGVSDLTARKLDATAQYLVHDLVHGFNTMEAPNATTEVPDNLLEELTKALANSVIPFYVTNQHLLFSSVRVLEALSEVFRLRLPRIPDSLPPSYNNKLTCATGDTGLVSIGYLFVVGVLEEVQGTVTSRAAYFPMEVRSGKNGWDRDWLQPDYLQGVILDKKWEVTSVDEAEKKLSSAEEEGTIDEPETTNGPHGDSANGKVEQNGKDTNGYHASDEANGSDEATIVENGDLGSTAETDGLLSEPVSEAPYERALPKRATDKRSKFLRDLDTLIDSDIYVVSANERRKSSASALFSEHAGLLQQVPLRLRVLYQIRVNNQALCTTTISKPFYHVGDDVNIFLEFDSDSLVSTRVVGLTAHIEAHECFHLEDRKMVNFYKVTPTVKMNTFAEAMANAYTGLAPGTVACMVNLPRHLTQQFQSSTFMDLKYFLICKFVLSEFATPQELANVDDDLDRYSEYIQDYKLDNESTEFKCRIPLTVLP